MASKNKLKKLRNANLHPSMLKNKKGRLRRMAFFTSAQRLHEKHFIITICEINNNLSND